MPRKKTGKQRRRNPAAAGPPGIAEDIFGGFGRAIDDLLNGFFGSSSPGRRPARGQHNQVNDEELTEQDQKAWDSAAILEDEDPDHAPAFEILTESEVLQQAWKRAAIASHPDRHQGSTARAARINDARDQVAAFQRFYRVQDPSA